MELTPFKIEINHSSDHYEHQNLLYKKEKTKRILIYQKNAVIFKIHLDLLENDFEKTFRLFQKEFSLTIPDDFDKNFVEMIVNYFYFKEIKEIPFEDIFTLLNISMFFEVDELNKELLNFLQKHLTNVKNVLFIREKSYHYFHNLKTNIIEQCEIFLITNNYFAEYLSQFNSEFSKIS